MNPGDADQSTRIDQPNGAGVTGNVDFSALNGELAAAKTAIPGLATSDYLDLTADGGKISSDLTIQLESGLNVIEIVTGGNDFLLENANFVIDGFEDSTAIFLLDDVTNFNVSNANILVGDGGIGLDSVLFYSDRADNAQHFNFSNTVLNGVAFWTLGMEGGEINLDNAQGCTQLIADKITLNDVRLTRCGPGKTPGEPVPEFFSAVVFAVVLWIVGGATRRANRRQLRNEL